MVAAMDILGVLTPTIEVLDHVGFNLGKGRLSLWIIIKTVRGGKKAGAKPWEGSQVGTPGLEWTLPSPPPFHSFSTPPMVK